MPSLNTDLEKKMFKTVGFKIISGPWHWFQWLFSNLPVKPFVASLVGACAECEERLPGLGWLLFDEVASISGREKDEQHYEMLMQKLSEILVLRQILRMPWPDGTTFQHEPTAIRDGKRPELKVNTPDGTFLFEVKAPSLLTHQRARDKGSLQFPSRLFNAPTRAMMEKTLSKDTNPVLPRDNPIKDFLTSAEDKFAEFAGGQKNLGILVIVWDDFIFEPITSLVHPEAGGLLTPESFARTPEGLPITYPNIDAVVIIRHLTYFQQGTAETLTERKHAFDFGGPDDLPNVFFLVSGGKEMPGFIVDGLRALNHTHPDVSNLADYRPQDFIWWF